MARSRVLFRSRVASPECLINERLLFLRRQEFLWIFPTLAGFTQFAEQPKLFESIGRPRPQRGDPGNRSFQ